MGLRRIFEPEDRLPLNRNSAILPEKSVVIAQGAGIAQNVG
jgi:hypothetical protein